MNKTTIHPYSKVISNTPKDVFFGFFTDASQWNFSKLSAHRDLVKIHMAAKFCQNWTTGRHFTSGTKKRYAGRRTPDGVRRTTRSVKSQIWSFSNTTKRIRLKLGHNTYFVTKNPNIRKKLGVVALILKLLAIVWFRERSQAESKTNHSERCRARRDISIFS